MHKSLPHQYAVNVRWSKENPAEQGRILRAGLEAKFRRQVDPDNELPEQERERRAAKARQAYYQKLALASAKARRARKVAKAAEAGAELRAGGGGRDVA